MNLRMILKMYEYSKARTEETSDLSCILNNSIPNYSIVLLAVKTSCISCNAASSK